jgi:hypothetical protein
MQSNVRRWLDRYLLAEVGGTLVALLGAWIAAINIGSPVAVAIGGNVGESFAFYATMLIREICARDRRAFPVIARGLMLEFGPAEAFDTMLIRPALLYYGLLMAPNAPLGILVGKIVADLCFYVPAIVSYELQRGCRLRIREEISK